MPPETPAARGVPRARRAPRCRACGWDYQARKLHARSQSRRGKGPGFHTLGLNPFLRHSRWTNRPNKNSSGSMAKGISSSNAAKSSKRNSLQGPVVEKQLHRAIGFALNNLLAQVRVFARQFRQRPRHQRGHNGLKCRRRRGFLLVPSNALAGRPFHRAPHRRPSRIVPAAGKRRPPRPARGFLLAVRGCVVFRKVALRPRHQKNTGLQATQQQKK